MMMMRGNDDDDDARVERGATASSR